MMNANKITDGHVDSSFLIPPLHTFPGNDVPVYLILICVINVATVIIIHVAKWPFALSPKVE